MAQVRLYREGLAVILREYPDIEVVGVAAGWRDEQLSRCCPDVVLLDMTGHDRGAAVRGVLATAPETKVVALGVADAEGDVVDCAEAGVSGYVTRDESPAHLASALRSVARGEMRCSPRIAATLLRRVTALAAEHEARRSDALTARELEILELIALGLSNKEIAQRLCIQLATVKNHVHHILEKLGVNRRTQAAARVRAMRHGSRGAA